MRKIGVPDVIRHLKASRSLAELRFRELQRQTILHFQIEPIPIEKPAGQPTQQHNPHGLDKLRGREP